VNVRRMMARIMGGIFRALGIVGPAAAEGTWTSYISNWYEGRESRQWIDKNVDNTDGWAAFRRCSHNDFRITVYKEDFGPDTNVGTETMQCKKGDSQDADRVYFGDPGADEYHFTLKSSVSGGLDVEEVQVTY